MSKVAKITLWESNRIGNGVEFLYITPEMGEDDPCIKIMITEDDLFEFIKDYELNLHQTDVDDFKTYNELDYLVDCFDEVKDQYWTDVLQPKLDQSYKEAIAYMESFKAKCNGPLSDKQVDIMLKRVEVNYGIHFRKEAA